MAQHDINMRHVLEAFEGLKRGQPHYFNKVADFLRYTLEEESQKLRTAEEPLQIYRQQGKCTMIQELLKHIDNAETLLQQFNQSQ